jgi:dTMP kinase
MTLRVEPIPSLATGKFITFEGGEGAGKSTQLRRLAERLSSKGVKVVSTREPGGSPRAERLREMLLAGKAKALGPLGEAILFTAARIDHVDNLIAPALARGEWVLCDRFADSTRAYQGAKGGVEPRLIALLERAALRGLRPDLTIILDLPAKIGMERAGLRRAHGEGRDRFESEDLGFHEELRQAFLDIAAAEPDRCCVVNSAAPEDEVADAIWRIVEARFFNGEDAAQLLKAAAQ